MITDKTLCTGCTACAHSCPADAIAMRESAEGFLYPVIDKDKCNDCGKCLRVCPAKGPAKEMNSGGEVFAIRSRNEDVVARSSSGGAASAIASHIIGMGGVVYGAGFDSDNRVLHKRIDTLEEVKDIAGSKYVQSYMNDTYPGVRRDLESGRQVLFFGTPCQCGGLKAYLAKEYNNLTIVDFVCHGVPSEKLYGKYLEFMSRDKRIKSVVFRDKGGDESGHCIGITYDDGSVYRKRYIEGDPYMLPFLQNISLRESCYNCSFKGLSSGSDITLGDFWGIDETDSVLKDKKGVSLFIINTHRGNEVFANIKDSLVWDKRSIDEALAQNRMIQTSTSYNPLRVAFYRDLNMLDVHKLCHKYCGDSVLAKLRRFIAKRTIK